MYRVGETIRPMVPFDDQQCFLTDHAIPKDLVYEPCSSGVHFFMRRNDAVQYRF
jgi:hypothetical protein